MASLLTHAVVGATLCHGAPQELRTQPAFWWAGVVCSILPDIDVIGFSFGIRYGDLWGHRGMTHSLLFAALVATCLAVLLEDRASTRLRLAMLLFVITAFHGFLDALTNGGLGVAFFSPFDPRRYFLPWRPILVSPIGVGGLFSVRVARVLWSEIPWIWLPALVVNAAIWAFRASQERRGLNAQNQ